MASCGCYWINLSSSNIFKTGCSGIQSEIIYFRSSEGGSPVNSNNLPKDIEFD